MALRLPAHGVTESAQATIATANSVTVAFLVMYFAWKSDHTVSRFGRRKPYLLLSAPFIIASTFLFPLLHNAASLVILFVIQMIFMDMKASTFPLLSIDCVRRDLLARAMSFLNIANGIVGFFSMQLVSMFTEQNEWIPYAIAAFVMLLTTVSSPVDQGAAYPEYHSAEVHPAGGHPGGSARSPHAMAHARSGAYLQLPGGL